MEDKIKMVIDKDGTFSMSTEEFNKILSKYDKERTELQKHCNGYAYDSLVYRYQLIRMRLAQYEAEEYLMMNGGSRLEARARANDLARRDIQRFGEILNEMMKEHD